MRRAVFCLRVSTQDQTTANQKRELLAVAKRLACEVVKVYKDHGCKDAARRQFDVVMGWSVDRLGRSLKDLIGFLSELYALKIDLFVHQQGLHTTTPTGKALFGMVFAEFERAMIKSGSAPAWCGRRRKARSLVAPGSTVPPKKKSVPSKGRNRPAQDRGGVQRRDGHGAADRARVAIVRSSEFVVHKGTPFFTAPSWAGFMIV
jgi:DNA invertase Pin-like site-specific DNA recombinase